MAIEHLAIPFRFVNGQAATVEQDSEDEIAQSVRILVSTQRGSRIEAPEYGIESALFKHSNFPITNEIMTAVARWEPRARVDVSSQIDDLDDLIRNIAVRVRPANVGN